MQPAWAETVSDLAGWGGAGRQTEQKGPLQALQSTGGQLGGRSPCPAWGAASYRSHPTHMDYSFFFLTRSGTTE